MSADELPTYSMEEVAKHASKEDGIWISYKDSIYDVTDFVDKHPGGSVIMTAAGSYADQMFMTYPFHKSFIETDDMSYLRIAHLRKEDAEKNQSHLYDPYENDPVLSNDLEIVTQKPICAGPPIEKLPEKFITPPELFYIRNHMPVPSIDPDTHEISVSGVGVETPKTYQISELKSKFQKHSVTTTLQCAGNRKVEMNTVKPVSGAAWNENAMYNAVWSGVLLYELLMDCGFKKTNDALHIQFEAEDRDPANSPYGASIPVEKLDPVHEVIIAYEVNNGPVPAAHGYPVRMIIPGVAGARNVKWLARIIVSKGESQCHYQQGDYKGFSPSVTGDTVDFSTAPAVQELPVTSVICNIKIGQQVQLSNGHLFVKGYAYSGGGRKIIRVDLTIDGGKNWVTADLTGNNEKSKGTLIHCWTWTLWEAKVPLIKTGEKELWAKAVDSSYNVQPESFKNIWNFLGILCNAYHRVKINVV